MEILGRCLFRYWRLVQLNDFAPTEIHCADDDSARGNSGDGVDRCYTAGSRTGQVANIPRIGRRRAAVSGSVPQRAAAFDSRLQSQCSKECATYTVAGSGKASGIHSQLRPYTVATSLRLSIRLPQRGSMFVEARGPDPPAPAGQY